jgi:O-antigen/teichoic acid export membrane protein
MSEIAAPASCGRHEALSADTEPRRGAADCGRALSGAVLTGASWSAISRAASQVISLISVTVVARLVPPQAYGLVGMAQVMIVFISLFRDIGSAAAIIQRRDITDRFVSSMYWANLGLGSCATVLCWLIAPAFAWFYRDAAVTNVIRMLSLTFLFGSIAVVPNALLTRQLNFKDIAKAELISGVASLVTAIVLASRGAGVWALVGATLVNTVAGTLLLSWLVRWRPRCEFDWADIRSMAGFGLSLSAFNIVNYFARNADNALVGRYLGALPLGYYRLAYNLMLYPVTGIAYTLGQVLLPAYSRIQGDYERLRRAYLRSVAAVSLLTFPMMAGLAVVSKEAVLVILGPKWLPAARILLILAPVGLLQSVVTTVGQIYVVTGRTDLMFRWGSLFGVVTVLSFVAGLHWGVEGVAIAYAIVWLLAAIPVLLPPCRLIQLPLTDYGKALWPSTKCTIIMLLTVAPLRILLGALWSHKPTAVLIPCTIAGAAAYCAAVMVTQPVAMQDLRAMVSTMISPLGDRFRAVVGKAYKV